MPVNQRNSSGLQPGEGDLAAGPSGAAAAPPIPSATPSAAAAAAAERAADDLPVASRPVQLGSAVIVGVYLGLSALGILAGLIRGLRSQNADATWAFAAAFGAVGLVLLLLHTMSEKKYGILRPLIGDDRRFSTSLTQAGLWTLAIGTAMAWLLFRAALASEDLAVVLPDDRMDDYLILLAGPFAAAIAAKGIVVFKIAGGTLQKTEAPTTEVKQVATDDGGATDLVDAQYLLFNVIAILYFAVQLTRTGALPVIPEVLLGLTSLTAATYVGNKAARRNAPVITSLSPTAMTAGTKVMLLGSNFDPNGATAPDYRIVTITITGLPASIEIPTYTNTRVWFTLPAGATPGLQTLRLTSTAGVESAARDVEVLGATV